MKISKQRCRLMGSSVQNYSLGLIVGAFLVSLIGCGKEPYSNPTDPTSGNYIAPSITEVTINGTVAAGDTTYAFENENINFGWRGNFSNCEFLFEIDGDTLNAWSFSQTGSATVSDGVHTLTVHTRYNGGVPSQTASLTYSFSVNTLGDKPALYFSPRSVYSSQPLDTVNLTVHTKNIPIKDSIVFLSIEFSGGTVLNASFGDSLSELTQGLFVRDNSVTINILADKIISGNMALLHVNLQVAPIPAGLAIGAESTDFRSNIENNVTFNIVDSKGTHVYLTQ